MTTQYSKMPAITDADRGWRMMVELLGYNPLCGWCNDACGIAAFGDFGGNFGVYFLHPADARAAGYQIFGQFRPVRMCVCCANRYNRITGSLKEEYDWHFPDGPKPLLSVDSTDPRQAAVLVKYFHRRVIELTVRQRGTEGLIENAVAAQAEIDALPKYLPPARLEDGTRQPEAKR